MHVNTLISTGALPVSANALKGTSLLLPQCSSLALALSRLCKLQIASGLLRDTFGPKRSHTIF